MPAKLHIMKHFLLACLFACPVLAEDAASIVRRSVERDRVNFERVRDYTFLERTVVREYDGRGRLKKTESETFDVLILGGRPYKQLTAKDDRPLSPAEAAKAEATFDKEMRKRQTETEKQRAKQAAKEEKERREARAFLAEVPEAFNFRMAGEEKVDGLPVWVIDAEPRAGFKSKVRRGDLLSKFRGRVWIAQGDLQWVRVEAETIGTVSFGLFLARLGPGARLSFEQRRVNDEVWLPSRATTRLDARVALLKRFNAEVDVEWKQYRKFQTDSRVVGAAELTAEP